MFDLAGTLAMLGFPGILPALILTGVMEGGSHGGRNTAAILALSVPLNLVFYLALGFAARFTVSALSRVVLRDEQKSR
jgi:hypothetical protein